MNIMSITFLLPVEDEAEAASVATAIKEGEFELDMEDMRYVVCDLQVHEAS